MGRGLLWMLLKVPSFQGPDRFSPALLACNRMRLVRMLDDLILYKPIFMESNKWISAQPG